MMAVVLLGSLWHTAVAQTKDDYVDFLYKYMPLPDKADYPRSFYEKNVALSLQAKAEMPWGNTVPEREFRHFVVPVRVNNENLDNSREVFYQAAEGGESEYQGGYPGGEPLVPRACDLSSE